MRTRTRDVKKHFNPPTKAHLLWSALLLLSVLAMCAMPFALAQSHSRWTAKANVTKPATLPVPVFAADRWEIARDLGSGVDQVTTPVFTVTNTNDIGLGSLRQAILDSNTSPPPPPGTSNLIVFDIPSSGVQTIVPATPLPDITQPLMIDGYTQPGSSPNTNLPGQPDNAVILIELSGAIAGGSGFRMHATDVAYVAWRSTNFKVMRSMLAVSACLLMTA